MTAPKDVQAVYDILCETDWPDDWSKDGITPELFQAQRIVAALQAMKQDDRYQADYIAGQKAMREECRKLARDWPAPTSGRIPIEIANGIATLPIEGEK